MKTESERLADMTAAHQVATEELADAALEISALKSDVQKLLGVISQSLRFLCCDEADGSISSGGGIEGAVCKIMMRTLEKFEKFKIEEDDDELPTSGRFTFPAPPTD